MTPKVSSQAIQVLINDVQCISDRIVAMLVHVDANNRILWDLTNLLLPYAGERHEAEGAVQCLTRIIHERNMAMAMAEIKQDSV